MVPQVRIYLIDKATEIVKFKRKKVTANNIAKEYKKLVSLMDIPEVEEEEETITTTYTYE